MAKKILCLPALLALGLGCHSGPHMLHGQVGLLDSLKDGEAVVVGLVNLNPELVEEELTIKRSKRGGIGRMFLNAFLNFGPGALAPGSQMPYKSWAYGNQVEWDTTFFARVKSRPQYLRSVSYVTDFQPFPQNVIVVNRMFEAGDTTAWHMPVNLWLDLKEEDEVVYIGVITIERDDYNGMKSVKVTDEFDKDLPLMKAHFGDKAPVRKALARIRKEAE